jgi:hypothetical protein
MATNEIENGTYTREQLSRMGGRRAWSAHVPAEEGETRDARRADLIGDAIEQIQEYETATGLVGAAEIRDDEVVAIVEAE